MYGVRPTENGLWEVVDESGQVVCSGTKEVCEDWLDAWENRPENRGPGIFTSLWQRLREKCTRLMRSEPK